MVEPEAITQILLQIQSGNSGAANQLFPAVYKELRHMAGRIMTREKTGHTLQPTALVHEAYLKLLGQRENDFKNRAHFFAIAAEAMRRILTDHARAKKAEKRGGPDAIRVDWDGVEDGVASATNEILDVDEALEKLGEINARHAKIVELRYFGGLSLEEVATVLDISLATVKRDWSLARLWLKSHFEE